MPIANPPFDPPPISFDEEALDGAVREIGDRWSLRLVGALLDGDLTFGELARRVDGIAPNTLAARLRSLQSVALVSATPYARRPLRMRYSLTEPGRRLGGAITSLAEWGARREGRNRPATHATCGTPLASRPWCPTCDRVVDAGEASDLVWC